MLRDASGDRDSEHSSESDGQLKRRRAQFLIESVGTPVDKVTNLPKYLSRQDVAKLCCYADAFRQTTGVAGSIVECGVFFGAGLMTWANLAAAFEPYNYNCRVIGFDTFAGNAGVTPRDAGLEHPDNQEGAYCADTYDDLLDCVALFDADRPLSQFAKVQLIRGDIRKTAQTYIESNPHLLVRLLSLTMNLYEPTRSALEAFVPRMSKGSLIVAFTLNDECFPGMTTAVLESLGVKSFRVETPASYSNVNYIHI